MTKSGCLGEVGVHTRISNKMGLDESEYWLDLPIYNMVQEWYFLGRLWTFIFHTKAGDISNSRANIKVSYWLCPKEFGIMLRSHVTNRY
jgi:hypothetical protein